MSAGEIGCALSHLHIWKNMSSPLLVFEDDIILTNNFEKRLEKALSSLPEDWDIFYLGYMNPAENGLAQFITPELCHVNFVFGTYAYILNKKGFQTVPNGPNTIETSRKHSESNPKTISTNNIYRY